MLIVEFGWEPGCAGRFYICTSDGRRHIVSRDLLKAHKGKIDLMEPYPFIDDDAGRAVSPRLN